MRVLALTSSYPRFEGDATAPFIESITTHVAALATPSTSSYRAQRMEATPSEGDVHFHPYRYSPGGLDAVGIFGIARSRSENQAVAVRARAASSRCRGDAGVQLPRVT